MAYNPNNNPYVPGDPYSYDLKWIVQHLKGLQSALDYLKSAYTSPTAVDTAAEMTDPNKIYVYVGTEPGYSTNHWYYYDPDTQLWTDGGSYGALDLDSAMSLSSNNAVKNSVITAALNGKQDTLSFPLSISQGGTGASTLANAQNHLQIAPYARYRLQYSETIVFTASPHSRHLICFVGIEGGTSGMVLLGVKVDGTMHEDVIKLGADLETTTGVETYTIANNGASGTDVCVFCLYGDPLEQSVS